LGIAAVNGSGYSFSTTSSSGGYTIAGTISSLSSSGTVSGTANVGANTYSVSASASTTPVSSSFAGLYTGTIWTGSTTNNGGVYGATAVQDRSSTYIVFTHNYNYQYVLDKNGDLLRFRSSDGKMIYPSGYVSSSFYIDSSSNFYYISPSTNTALLRGKVVYTGQPGTGNLIASLIDTLGFYVDVDESLLKVSYPGDTIPACPYTLSLSVDNYGNVTGTVSISSAINGGKPFIIGGAGTVSSAGVFNFTASNTFDTSFSTSYSGSISTAGVVTGTYTFNAGAGSRNINALKQSSTTYVAPVSGVAPVVIKNSSGFEGDPTGNGGGS